VYSECLKSKLPKSKLCRNRNGREFGIQTVQISDVWAFGTTPQLSEIRTGHLHHNTTFKCYLLSTYPSPLGDGGSGLKRKALHVVLCFTIISWFQCLKSKLSGNGTQLNCLKSKLARISDIHCILVTNDFFQEISRYKLFSFGTKGNVTLKERRSGALFTKQLKQILRFLGNLKC